VRVGAEPERSMAMLIFGESTIQSLTVDEAVLLGTEPELNSWRY
jgi:hypothetical protein